MRKEQLQIKIRTSALTEGLNKLDFTCHAGDFRERGLAEAGFTGEIKVNVEADKSDDKIYVSIYTAANADFSCDRCLEPVSAVLEASLDLIYTFSSNPDGNEEESDEYRQIEKSTEYIDLTDDVCDALILSLPMKITCTDNPDCRLYSSSDNSDSHPGETSSWQESLEKLKNKYC